MSDLPPGKSTSQDIDLRANPGNGDAIPGNATAGHFTRNPGIVVAPPVTGSKISARLRGSGEYAWEAALGLISIAIDFAFLAGVGGLNYLMDNYVWATFTTSDGQLDTSIVILETIFAVSTVGYAVLRMLKSLMITAARFGFLSQKWRSRLHDLITPGPAADMNNNR